MKKTDPYQLIKEAGLKPEELGEQGLKVLSIYDDAVKMLEKRPDDTSVKETTEKTFIKVESAIKKIIKVVAEQKKTQEDKEAEARLKKENSSLTMKEINAGLEELADCDAELKRLKKAKRDKEGKKPKQKTRYTKLKEKLLAVTTLIPDNLKNDVDTLKKTEGILLVAHRELIKAWGMNKVTGKAGERAIEDKFDELERKTFPTDQEIIKHLQNLDSETFSNHAAYILSLDLDKTIARVVDDKQHRIKIEQNVAKHIVKSDPNTRKTYLKEIGYKTV